MDKALIEKLKMPELAQPLGLLSKEEHGILTRAGKENTLFFDASSKWVSASRTWWDNDVIILKPDYKPEPEYEDCKVFVCGGILGIDHPTFKPLYTLPGLPDFEGFFRNFPTESSETVQLTDVDAVAKVIRQGKVVAARFVKEG